MTAEDVHRFGRADLHIHTLASDGTSSVVEILDHVESAGTLDVIAITDHERIDAAVAGRQLAADRGLRIAVIVGEEITTRGGHLLGLFLERPVPALRGLGWSIEAIHDQGGLAIPAHPLVPYPLCAQGFVLRRLLASDDPARRPDAIETFNPTALRPIPPRERGPLRRRARPAARSATATPTSPPPSAAAGRRFRAGRRTTCGRRSSPGRRATTAPSTEASVSWARSGASCASTGAARGRR